MSEEKDINEQKFLQFNLANECFAIRLLTVKEVVSIPETTPVPNSPSYYKGIMNLRGQIISIIDLREKLNIAKATTEHQKREAVIIVEYDGVNIGVIVDSINKVINIHEENVGQLPELNNQVNSKYVEGVYKGENHLTILLDLELVLDINLIKQQLAAA